MRFGKPWITSTLKCDHHHFWIKFQQSTLIFPNFLRHRYCTRELTNYSFRSHNAVYRTFSSKSTESAKIVWSPNLRESLLKQVFRFFIIFHVMGLDISEGFNQVSFNTNLLHKTFVIQCCDWIWRFLSNRRILDLQFHICYSSIHSYTDDTTVNSNHCPK